MTAQEFCYWLQGFFEMTDAAELTPTQVAMIRDHLKLAFLKVTPDRLPDSGRREPAPFIPSIPDDIRQALDALREQAEQRRKSETQVPFKLPEVTCSIPAKSLFA